MNPEGLKFLKNQYNDLHNSDEVTEAAARTGKRTGETIPKKPEAQIQNYLDRFKEITDRTDPEKKERGLRALKKILHKQYIIDHLPESHIELQRRIAREQGQEADFPEEVSDEQRAEYLDIIQKDQAVSLDRWVDYLSSNDALYPDWTKYWAFRSMLTMSTYDKEEHKFGTRTKDTTAMFPDLNREALAYVVDIVEKMHSPELAAITEQIKQQQNRRKKARTILHKNPDDVYAQDALEQAEVELTALKQEKAALLPQNPVQAGENEFAEEGKLVSDEDFDKLLSAEDFAKYYAFAIEHVVADNSELYKITEGEWRKFEQGSDPHVLTSTIQGHGTGWCTAGESTAAIQLEGGDFYVYYSKNELGEANIPRLAIRMEEDRIGEVRGVAHQQEIDSYIAPILEEKMDEFGAQGEKYKKKAADMKRLTDIDNRHQAGKELSKEDLRFLYEIDDMIEGFGYEYDPRIAELKEGRDQRADLSLVFDCRPDQISLTEKEALSGDIVYHYGHLNLNNLTTAEKEKLRQQYPQYVDKIR